MDKFVTKIYWFFFYKTHIIRIFSFNIVDLNKSISRVSIVSFGIGFRKMRRRENERQRRPPEI